MVELRSFGYANPGGSVRTGERLFDGTLVEFVTEGRGAVVVRGESHEVAAGDVYVVCEGTRHELRCEDAHPWKKVYFSVRGQAVDLLCDLNGWNRHVKGRSLVAGEMIDRVVERLSGGDPLGGARLAFSLHEILYHAAKDRDRSREGEERRHASLRLVEDFVEGNLERKLSLDDLSKVARVSPSHLNRLFREGHGLSPYRYLIEKRLLRSQRWLALGEWTLYEIAERLCFSDEFHFSKMFKKRFGESPSAYRKRMQREA